MSTATDILPIERTAAPADLAELVAEVRACGEAATPIYPIGGGSSLDYGLAARRPGLGLELTGLNRVIDYPARDMTITVESGITMAALSDRLAAERQRLPIDVPHAERATLGGVLATNWSGPRRYGCGTIRDYTIGIQAVDGRGTAFRGGGRVVKNVAGYDFCKLLVGSLGTLAVITEITLKVVPIPEASALMACDVSDLDMAERLLAALVDSRTTPTAIELVAGPAWQDDEALGSLSSPAAARLIVGVEGTQPEVAWMIQQLTEEWQRDSAANIRRIDDAKMTGLWRRLTDFPSGEAPLVLKASLLPSRVTAYIERLRAIDPGCSVLAHGGSGIVLARLSEFTAADVSQKLVANLQPAARAAGGHVVVLSASDDLGLTRQAVWDGAPPDIAMMRSVKAQFDPQGLLNPGRFVLES